MNKIFRIAVILALIPALFLGLVNVCLAEPILSGYDVWDTRTTDDVNKSWTVKFSGPLATETVNSGNIFITDSGNRPVTATLIISGDGAAVTIRPASPYTAGNEYRLYVTSGVCRKGSGGQRGAALSRALVMPFIVESQGDIKSISNVYNALVTVVNVTAGSTVHSVSLNGTAMQYLGNNKFRLGVPGLARGAKVNVKAYDGSGNLLVVRDYTIQ